LIVSAALEQGLAFDSLCGVQTVVRQGLLAFDSNVYSVFV